MRLKTDAKHDIENKVVEKACNKYKKTINYYEKAISDFLFSVIPKDMAAIHGKYFDKGECLHSYSIRSPKSMYYSFIWMPRIYIDYINKYLITGSEGGDELSRLKELFIAAADAHKYELEKSRASIKKILSSINTLKALKTTFPEAYEILDERFKDVQAKNESMDLIEFKKLLKKRPNETK